MAEKYSVSVEGGGGGGAAGGSASDGPKLPRTKSMRPPGEEDEDDDPIVLEDDKEYVEAEPCCQSCIAERMPISRLEQREARHDVAGMERKCTDCACFVLYWVFCGCWLAVAVAALWFGNWWALTHGRDYQGRLCGYDEGVENKSFVGYPRLNHDLMEFAISLGVDLLSLDVSALSLEQLFSINITGICVESCPVIGDVTCSYDYLAAHDNEKPSYDEVLQCNNGDPFDEEYLLGLFNAFSVQQENRFMCTHCWIASLDSTEIFNRCLDIVFTTRNTTEKCVFPVNTSISADDPNCQTKEVVVVEDSLQPAYDNPVAVFLGDVVETLYGWLQSVMESWYVILVVGVVVALLLGFMYVIFMRYCAGFVVWMSVVGIILVAAAFGAWCYIKSGWIPAEWVNFVAEFLDEIGIASDFVVASSVNDSYEVLETLDIDITEFTTALQDAWKVFAVVMTIVVVILIIVAIVIAKKINIAIALIEQASKVMLRLPGLIILPFVTVLVIIAFSGWMVFLLLMITSLEDFTVDTVLQTFEFEQYFDCNGTDTTNVTNVINEAACYTIDFVSDYGETPLELCMVIYHLFMYLWTVQFIHAVMICIVAGAICDWYWTRPSGPDEVKGGDGEWGDPICKSCCRTFRFHLGSMLFGAMIVAIVQIIRWVMAYIDKHTKSWQDKSKCLKCMFKVVHCCLCCFERCIKFISKNAYIMVAMEGHPFCDSCCHSMKLMIRNIIQFAVLNVFSQVIVMLGKIFIIAVVTGLAYAWLTYAFTGIVSTIVFPTILTGLLGWFTSIAFLHVYDLAMATILLCFCEDLEVHKNGLEREVLMNKKLQRLALKNVAHPRVMTKEEVAKEIEIEKHGRELKPVKPDEQV